MVKDPYQTARRELEKIVEFSSKVGGDTITEKHGIWSLKKMIVLYQYIKPYHTIVSKSGRKLHYVDLYSGSGIIKVHGTRIIGTPMIPFMLIDKYRFDEYFLSDEDQAYIDALGSRISDACNMDQANIQLRHAKFEESVDIKFRDLPDGNMYLVVVDPYAYNFRWEKLEKILKERSVDMLLTFMTYEIDRNITNKDAENSLNDLFGDDSWKHADNLLDAYTDKIHKIRRNDGEYKTQILGIENKRGRIYHMIFISISDPGHDVFEWIKWIEEIDNKQLESILDAIKDPRASMDNYIEKR